MKRKIIRLNLGEMSEEDLLEMLNENEADNKELTALLTALFEMWSSALRFSGVVVKFAEEHNPEFLDGFIHTMGERTGASPQQLDYMLNLIRNRISNPTVLH